MNQTPPDPDQFLRITALAGGALWSIRREIGPLLGGALAGLLTHHQTAAHAGTRWQPLVVLFAVGTATIIGSRLLWTSEQFAAGRASRRRWTLRRHWPAAASAVGLTDEQGTPATLRRIRGGAVALTGELLVPRGRSIDDVVRAAPALASALQVRSVEVQPNAADASRCMLRFGLGEPFGDPVPWTPRVVSNGRLDVGHDEDGETA